MAQGKDILVVGDLMVDRNWLVPSKSAISTSQAHDDVPPSKLIGPRWQTDVLGGAGVVARAALVAAPNSTIYLAGAWKDGFDPRDFLCPEDKKNGGRIKFIRAAKTPFNTEKFRIYEQSSKGEKLANRYDRDLYWDEEAQNRSNGDEIYRYNTKPDIDWPSPKDVGVVIVADFAKGLLDMKLVIDKLKAYAGKRFLLRAKRGAKHPVFTELPWELALPNRDDLGKLVGMEPVEPQSFRRTGGTYTLNPKLAESLIEFRRAFPKSRKYSQRSVLAKLDREGALLYERSGAQEILTVLALPAGQPTLAGIGAGDVLAANLAAILLKQVKLNYLDACKEAVPLATAFCKGATKISNAGNGSEQGWYGVGVFINPTTFLEERAGLKPGPVTSPLSEAVDALVNRNQQARRCREALQSAKPISINDASWFLDKFLTVDKGLGSEILRLKKEIRAYFEAQERNPKPFVVALCGSPGSGKSALAEALAEALKVDVLKANAAQWTSVEDLFRLCEEVRTIRVKKGRDGKAFAFIDEVDTAVGGEKVYGKLLAPLGDGAYSSLGYTRQMGPVVFLLAGSNKPWQTKSQLLGNIPEKDNPKLPDLVSRFSSPPIEVPALKSRRLDTLYLAAFLLHARFPGMEKVERGVLKLLCESEPKHGPRSIKEAVGMFGTPKNPSCITSEDLKQSEDTIELHLGKPFPRAWREDKIPIRIVL
jgi:ATPase family associated with various cellular activities (AAA)